MNKTLKIILITTIALALAIFGYTQVVSRTYTCYDLSGQAYESDIDCTQWQT